MADRSRNLHDNVTPTSGATSTDALATAQAAATELASRYTTDQTLTPAERSNLVADLKDVTRVIDLLQRGNR